MTDGKLDGNGASAGVTAAPRSVTEPPPRGQTRATSGPLAPSAEARDKVANPPPRAPRWTHRTLGLLVAAAVLWGGLYVYRTSFVVEGERYFTLWDDAMISMQYARNLVEGNGLVWIPGDERVLGVSNPGVAAVMAAIHLLPLPPSKLSLVFQLVNLAIFAVCLVLVWRIASRLFPDRSEVALGATLLSLVSGSLAIWTLQGSDVGFMALWILAGTTLLVSSAGWPARMLPLLALGFWIRIDAALFFLLFLGLSILYPGGRIPRLLRGVGVLAVLSALAIGACWVYYGDPLPNTYYLKATGSPRLAVLGVGFGDLLDMMPGLGAVMLFAGIGLSDAFGHRAADRCGYLRRGLLACAVLFMVPLAYNVWVGSDWIPGHMSRFLVPSLPLVFILASAGLSFALDRLEHVRIRATTFLMTILVLGVWVTPPSARLEWLLPSSTTMYRGESSQLVRYSQYLVEHTDPTTLLGAGWAGIAPYFSRRPAVDTLGKSDRHIAKLRPAYFAPGHSKQDWDYILHERKPDTFFRIYPNLDARSDFQSLYSLAVREDFYFYVRRDALPKFQDVGTVFALPLTTPEEIAHASELMARSEISQRNGADPWEPVAARFEAYFRTVYPGERLN